MEMYTRAALSLVSEATFNKLWSSKYPSPSNVCLCSYSRVAIPIAGSMDVTVVYKGQAAQLPLIVMNGEGPSLFRRNWLENLRFDWRKINHLQYSSLESDLEEHKTLFQPGLGTLKGHKVNISLGPRFHKPCPNPYAFRPTAEIELEQGRYIGASTICTVGGSYHSSLEER